LAENPVPYRTIPHGWAFRPKAEVFPGHRYRLSEFAEQRNRGYMLRLEQARDGITIDLVALVAP
jgi:hypothetical protein